ncbi:MAG: hypothetical protein OXC00_06530, partial [Acidimicrobiaceae bacterium]|nr:hypothetical protein [Acidimicrobiaceae bacterium]
AGELDAETPVAYARTLADGLPDVELVVLDGVGHLAVSEAPHTFNRLVREVLSRRHARVRTQDASGDPGGDHYIMSPDSDIMSE